MRGSLPSRRYSVLLQIRGQRLDTDGAGGFGQSRQRAQAGDQLARIAWPVVGGERGQCVGGQDAATASTLATQAWALQRWRADAVDAQLSTRDDAQAEAWTAALRSALALRGIVLGKIERSRSGEPRLQLSLASE